MYLTKLWYLKNISILEWIAVRPLERLRNFTAMSRVKIFQDIYFPEEGSNHVYFIQEGHVKLSRLDDEGHPRVIDLLSPGEIFGKLAIEGRDIPNEFAEAANDVTVCVISKGNFQALLAQVPELHFHIHREFGNKVQELRVKISDLVFKDATRRVANFLACYGQGSIGSPKLPITIDAPLSVQELSNLTGTSSWDVTMVLDELQKGKLIEFTSQSLLLHDLVSLRKLAQ